MMASAAAATLTYWLELDLPVVGIHEWTGWNGTARAAVQTDTIRHVREREWMQALSRLTRISNLNPVKSGIMESKSSASRSFGHVRHSSRAPFFTVSPGLAGQWSLQTAWRRAGICKGTGHG